MQHSKTQHHKNSTDLSPPNMYKYIASMTYQIKLWRRQERDDRWAKNY